MSACKLLEHIIKHVRQVLVLLCRWAGRTLQHRELDLLFILLIDETT